MSRIRSLVFVFLFGLTSLSGESDFISVSDKDQPKLPEAPNESYPEPAPKQPGEVIKKKKRINRGEDWGPTYPKHRENLNKINRYEPSGEEAIENDPNDEDRMGPGTNLNKDEVEEDEGHPQTLGGPGTDLNQEVNSDGVEKFEGKDEDLNKMKGLQNSDGNPQDVDLTNEPKPTLPSKKQAKPAPVQSGPTKVSGESRLSSGLIAKETKGLILFGSKESFNLVDPNSLSGFHTVNLDIPTNPRLLERRLNPIYLGKPLTKQLIKRLIDEIEVFFKEHNRPLTKVVVPRQGIVDGVLSLLVIQSKLGNITSRGNVWLSDERLQEYVKLQPGEVIDEQLVRESIDFVNRNPFRTVEAVYGEGTHYQTTDIELVVKERSPLRAYIGSDSLGLPAIDITRFFIGFNYGNLFGADQILSYQFTTSKSFDSYQSHTASYVIPLPWHDILEFYGGYSTVKAKLPYPYHRNKGSSMQASARYTIPLPLHFKGLSHELRFGFDFKQMDNTLEFQVEAPKYGETANVTQVVAGYQLSYLTKWLKSEFQVDGYYSPGQWLGHQSEEIYNTLRVDAKPKYVYGRGELKETLLLPYSGELVLRVAGQGSTVPLIPSEQFGIGGLETVRGYEERAINGDLALLATAELKFPPFNGFIRPRTSRSGILVEDLWQLSLFCDYGRAWVLATENGLPDDQYLLGVGPGVNYQIGQYFYAKFDVGYKVHQDETLYGGGKFMFHFMAMASF